MSGGSGPGELRIGDAERESAVTALSEHYAAGRITREELDQRLDLAWQARTPAGLRPLFADHPPPYPSAPAPVHPVGPARRPEAPVAPRRSGRSWGGGRGGGWVFPLLVVLGVLFVVGNLPWFVLGLALWFLVFRRGFGCGPHRRSIHRS